MKLGSILSVLLLFVSMQAQFSASVAINLCPDVSWYEISGSCYKLFFDRPLPYNKAKAECEALLVPATLAELESVTVDYWLTEYMFDHGIKDAWIGIENTPGSTDWSLSYLNWKWVINEEPVSKDLLLYALFGASTRVEGCATYKEDVWWYCEGALIKRPYICETIGITHVTTTPEITTSTISARTTPIVTTTPITTNTTTTTPPVTTTPSNSTVTMQTTTLAATTLHLTSTPAKSTITTSSSTVNLSITTPTIQPTSTMITVTNQTNTAPPSTTNINSTLTSTPLTSTSTTATTAKNTTTTIAPTTSTVTKTATSSLNSTTTPTTTSDNTTHTESTALMHTVRSESPILTTQISSTVDEKVVTTHFESTTISPIELAHSQTTLAPMPSASTISYTSPSSPKMSSPTKTTISPSTTTVTSLLDQLIRNALDSRAMVDERDVKQTNMSVGLSTFFGLAIAVAMTTLVVVLVLRKKSKVEDSKSAYNVDEELDREIEVPSTYQPMKTGYKNGTDLGAGSCIVTTEGPALLGPLPPAGQ